jgi:uncharacterized protein
MKTLFFLALGVLFGLVLSRSGAADFGMVQGMFLLRNFWLYGIIGSAIAVAAPGLYLLSRHGRSASGSLLQFTVKSPHRGNLVGGALFGVGWAMTGMCPGPIFVNLGEGKLYAIPALVGALVGAWLYGVFQPGIERLRGLQSTV